MNRRKEILTRYHSPNKNKKTKLKTLKRAKPEFRVSQKED